MKSLTVIIFMLHVIALASAATTNPVEDQEQRQQCLMEAARYLALAPIDTPIQTLIEKSREFYPDVLVLIDESVCGRGYKAAMAKIGHQLGCEQLEARVQKLDKEIACYAELETDENGLLDMAKLNESAKHTIEAYFACTYSR